MTSFLYLLVEMLKEVITPSDESQLVDFVDALATLLAFTTHPMSEIKKYDNKNSVWS